MAVALYVQKFGGTSVGTPDRIREVADHAARCVKRGDQVVLVVSAMGKETDELLRLADDVSTSKPGREMDMLITGGERKACALVAMALTDLGIESESFTGSQAGFLTDTTHRNAKILEVNPRRIADAVAAVTALATPENLAAWEQPVAEARDEDEGHTSSPKKRGGGGRRNS